MLSSRLRKNRGLFRRFTGLRIDQFDELLAELQPIYAANESKRLHRKNRIRNVGGGAQFALSLDDRLLILLLYYKLYITHEFLGLLFNLDDSNISRNIKHLNPFLAEIFCVPERRIRLTDEDKNELLYFFFDGTEQPINRPKKGQKKSYSGKKKCHTIKWQIVTRDGKNLDAVSKSYPGKMHDKKIYDKTRVERPPDSRGIGDTGYLGTNLIQPIKKKKGKKLTKAQKKYNRKISRLRIKAEHAIAAMKHFRVVRDKFRNPLNSHNLYVKNVAGLVNLANT